MDDQLEKLVQAVLDSAKYHAIDPALIARIGAGELAKGLKLKAAVKATKNKLHQVGGAYQTVMPSYSEWLVALTEAEADSAKFKLICREVMAAHASTRERLPILNEFYTRLFAELPPIESVLDVACGLNPLAIPWMGLAPGTRYYACDMYKDMVGFVQAYLDLLPVEGRGFVCDVSANPPDIQVDLAMVLKTIPCLEQIDKQAGARLLDGLRARYLLVSFPAKSLGGREKGMAENYEKRFEELTAGRGWRIRQYAFESELSYFIETHRAELQPK